MIILDRSWLALIEDGFNKVPFDSQSKQNVSLNVTKSNQTSTNPTPTLEEFPSWMIILFSYTGSSLYWQNTIILDAVIIISIVECVGFYSPISVWRVFLSILISYDDEMPQRRLKSKALVGTELKILHISREMCEESWLWFFFSYRCVGGGLILLSALSLWLRHHHHVKKLERWRQPMDHYPYKHQISISVYMNQILVFHKCWLDLIFDIPW